MQMEIITTSTWYKYPEYLPPDSIDEFEVLWHWDNGINKNIYHLSYVTWDGRWEELDEYGIEFTYFENPVNAYVNGHKRVVLYWRKVEYPVIN